IQHIECLTTKLQPLLFGHGKSSGQPGIEIHGLIAMQDVAASGSVLTGPIGYESVRVKPLRQCRSAQLGISQEHRPSSTDQCRVAAGGYRERRATLYAEDRRQLPSACHFPTPAT